LKRKNTEYQGKVGEFWKLRDTSLDHYYYIQELYEAACQDNHTEEQKADLTDRTGSEVQQLHNDIVLFIKLFKNDFTDHVQWQKINEIEEIFGDESGFGELADLYPIDDPILQERMMSSANHLKHSFKDLSLTVAKCIKGGAAFIKAIVSLILSNGFLFVPGVGPIAILFRSIMLAKYVFFSIKFFYQAKQTKNNMPLKWDRYGRSFGAFLRAIVYLLTGARRNLKQELLTKN